MIPDLRARLKAVADKPKPVAAPCDCKVMEARTPLSALGDVLSVESAHVRRLGLDFPAFDVRRALFLDTETTGLRGAGTVAFLVGLGWVEGDAFVVHQLLMRDYPEEVPLLQRVAEILPRFTSVVTFNGKSFDAPLLRDRFTMARLRGEWRDLPHLDLLHAARRTWRLRLGTCSLSSLEGAVLGIAREGDIPGSEVPERYFQYLKTGDASLLDDVTLHNAQDIRTLASLLVKLTRVYAQPEVQESLLDVFSIGCALEKVGEGEQARRCFQVASVSALSEQARLRLAQSYRREKDYLGAADAYRGLIARGEAGPDAYTALAVLLERWLDDPAGALDIVDKALWRFSGGGFLRRADEEAIAAFSRRRARLRAKINRRAEGE